MLRFLNLAVLLSCAFSASVLAQQDNFTLLREQVESARQQGQMDNADQLANQYLILANQRGDLLEQGRAYFNLGRNAMERNRYPDAKAYLQQAINLFLDINQQSLLAESYRQLGLTYRYQSDYGQALDNVYLAMQIYQTQQDTKAMASVYNSIGTILEKMGQFEEALQAHQQSLDLHYQTGDQEGIASAIFNLGDLNRTMGDRQKALSYFLQALEMDQAVGDPKNIAYSHNKLGFLYSELGNFAQSALHLNQALALFEQIHAPRDADWARTSLAKLAMDQGNYNEAQQLLDGLIARAMKQEYKSLLVDAYKLAAELAIKKEEYSAALGYIEAGVIQARLNNERADEAILEKLRVQVLVKQDAVREALAALQHQKQLDDELFNAQRAATIANIQAQADFTRQQNQIELLKKEQALQLAMVEQHRLYRNFWILGLAAGFTLLLMLYHRHNQKRLNRRLEQQVASRTEELQDKNLELQAAYKQLETISLTDKLTGLHNRHFLESHIESDLIQSQRLYQDWQRGKTPKPEGADLVVFLIDLDNFKALNDKYGHNVGDDVLRMLKQRMQQVFRHSDYLVRWGGEEFVAVARFIRREDATSLAQRFVDSIRHSAFSPQGTEPLWLTCSVGYVCYPLAIAEHNPWATLIKLADLCLYAAKHSGRDGWVGLDDITADPSISLSSIDSEQIQQLVAQGKLHIQHSFASPLRWHSSTAK